MSAWSLPPAYPCPFPPGPSGRHFPPSACQFCGAEKGDRTTCPGCGITTAIDCRGVDGGPFPVRLVECEGESCSHRGEVEFDIHETWDGWALHYWCVRHCPECTTPDERT